MKKFDDEFEKITELEELTVIGERTKDILQLAQEEIEQIEGAFPNLGRLSITFSLIDIAFDFVFDVTKRLNNIVNSTYEERKNKIEK